MNHLLRIFLPLLVAFVGLAGGGLLVRFRKTIDPGTPPLNTPNVVVQKVHATSYQIGLRTRGKIMAPASQPVITEVAGRVLSMHPSLQTGGQIRKGEVLIELDNRDHALKLTVVTAKAKRARLALDVEEAEKLAAEKEWQALGDPSAPNPLALRIPQWEQARHDLAAAEAELELARRVLDRCRILAPIQGVILEEQVEAGQFLPPGFRICTLQEERIREILLPLTDAQWPLLVNPEGAPNLGTPVKLQGSEGSWTGIWVRMHPVVDPLSLMRHAVVRLEESQALPLPGTHLEAIIQGPRLDSVWVVPSHALRQNRRLAWVDTEDRLQFQEVHILHQEDGVSILGAPLPPDGSRVCLSVLEVEVAGMKVRPLEDGNP